MDFNIEVRKKQLQSLDQYITSSKDKVQSILEYLGWNSKKILETEPKSRCSMNPNHQTPLKNAEKHLRKCYFRSLGYDSTENLLSEPMTHDPTASITLDNAKKVEILSQARYNNPKFKAAWNGQDSDPLTSNRLFSTFSPDERLTLYDYCTKNTEGPPVPSEFNVYSNDKKEEKPLTEEEILSQQRDAKRWRPKYRSVRTSRNKCYTDVIREVIENQMELYTEQLTKNVKSCTYSDATKKNGEQKVQYMQSSESTQQQTEIDKEKTEELERPHSSISRNSAHSSNSKSRREEYQKSDDHKRKEEYSRSHDKRSHSPYPDKRKRHSDSKDSRDYSRDRRSRRYRSDYRR